MCVEFTKQTMSPTAYDLYKFVESKGYTATMAAMVTLETYTKSLPDAKGDMGYRYGGNGDSMKLAMEHDRVNVFKAFYGETELVESTWLAGEEPGKGMTLPRWQERFIHAEVMVMKQKVETAMDFLLHELAQVKTEK